MMWLDRPTREIWETRQAWFESLSESYENRGGSYIVGDQSCALCGDVELAFCAGAWTAVMVLTIAVIDSQLRETGFDDSKCNTKDLLSSLDSNQEDL